MIPPAGHNHAATGLPATVAGASHRALAQRGWTRPTLAAVCESTLATVWIAAALLKAHDPADFAATIRAHGLLPAPETVAYTVIACELFLGIALALKMTRRQHGTNGARRPVAEVASLLLVAAMGLYIAAVPTTKLEVAGCGCGGAALRPALGAGSIKLGHGLFTAALGLLHLPLFVQKRRRASDSQSTVTNPAPAPAGGVADSVTTTSSCAAQTSSSP